MTTRLFRKLPDAHRDHDIMVMVEGQPTRVKAGERTAAAALLAGMVLTRTHAVSVAPRASIA